MSVDDIEVAGVPTIPESFPEEAKPGLAPASQILRYLCVGIFNTVFGYLSYAITFTLLSAVIAPHLLYLATPLAAVITTPLNITIAFLGYKFFVFRTRGNYVKEWLKCFAVYGTGMLPGLFALSAITRLLQSILHNHAAQLIPILMTIETHLSGRPLITLQHIGHSNTMAGYLAGAVTMGFTTVFGFIGHKKVTFATKPS